MFASHVSQPNNTMKNKLWIPAIVIPFAFAACGDKTTTEEPAVEETVEAAENTTEEAVNEVEEIVEEADETVEPVVEDTVAE